MDLVPTDFANALTRGSDLSFLSDEEATHLLSRGHLTELTPYRERAEFIKTVEFISNKVAKANKKQANASVTFVTEPIIAISLALIVSRPRCHTS